MDNIGKLMGDLFKAIKEGAGENVAKIEKEIRKTYQKYQITTVIAPNYKVVARLTYGSTMKNASMIAVQTKSNLSDDGNLNNLASGLRGGLAEGVSNKVKFLKGKFDAYNTAGMG